MTKKKGAGIDFVLPGARPGGAAGTVPPAGDANEGGPAAGVTAMTPTPAQGPGDTSAPLGRKADVAVASGEARGQVPEGSGSGLPSDGAALLSSASDVSGGLGRGPGTGSGTGSGGGPSAEGAGTTVRDGRSTAGSGVPTGLAPDRQRGRTGVGLLAETVFESQRLERRIAELNGRVEQLTAERGAQAFDPRLIAPSRWANRHPDAFEGPEFEQLRREIEDAGGNVQPIKIRPIADGRVADGRGGDLRGGEGGARYEIVFGHRRHRACLDLGLPVLAVVEDLNDAGLFVQMERENRGRENLSAWEQGRMYLRAIEEGLFPSNVKLAAAIGRDPSDIGKAVRAAKLPSEVTSAFPSPTSIQFRWVADLERAFREHEAKVLAAARELGQLSPRPLAADVFTALTAPLRQRGVGPSHPTRELDFGSLGRGTIRQDKQGRTVVELPPGAVTMERWAALEAALRKLMG
ncbi:MAG TPA: ParB/RepB/Spo0J family partition protein [Aquabacterium sp.]|nr:ParB/RepB/Spo0J family partition protein [Aquabacterium sp.]